MYHKESARTQLESANLCLLVVSVVIRRTLPCCLHRFITNNPDDEVQDSTPGCAHICEICRAVVHSPYDTIFSLCKTLGRGSLSLDVCVLSVQLFLRVVCSTSLKSECQLLAAWSAPGHGEVKNEVEAPIKIDFHDLNERPSVGTPTDFNKISTINLSKP